MTEGKSCIELWDEEYATGGLPSSERARPSGAVVWAVGQLQKKQAPLRRAVDVGCGKGRNSLYLASQGISVTAMDFTPNAIQSLRAAVSEQKLEDKVRPIVQDVTEDWPVGRDDIDLVVDAFCFKHITERAGRVTYRRNLLQVLGARGHYMISFASLGDGYYGRYVTPDEPEDGIASIVDPANGIGSMLFSRERVINFFAPELDLCDELKHNKPCVMHGETCERETIALLFQRKKHCFFN